MTFELAPASLAHAGRLLQDQCHGASCAAGWWQDLKSGDDYRKHVIDGTRLGKALVAEKLCLAHSEISEAMEGHRKGLMDDKLPHRTMLEVELADAVIRIADLAGRPGPGSRRRDRREDGVQRGAPGPQGRTSSGDRREQY